MRSTRDDVLERIGIPRDVIEAVGAAFRVSGERSAGSRVPDEVVSRLVLGGDPDQIEARLRIVEKRRVDCVSILSFGDSQVVQDTLQRFALDVMARFD